MAETLYLRGVDKAASAIWHEHSSGMDTEQGYGCMASQGALVDPCAATPAASHMHAQHHHAHAARGDHSCDHCCHSTQCASTYPLSCTRPVLTAAGAWLVSGDTLYVHGGFGNFVLGNVFALDLATMMWRELGPFARAPPKVQGHCLAVHGDRLWLFGGTNELNAPMQRLYTLDLALVAPEARSRKK